MAQLKAADSLNGLLDLGQRLHSMPAVLDMSSMIRCALMLRSAILKGTRLRVILCKPVPNVCTLLLHNTDDVRMSSRLFAVEWCPSPQCGDLQALKMLSGMAPGPLRTQAVNAVR